MAWHHLLQNTFSHLQHAESKGMGHYIYWSDVSRWRSCAWILLQSSSPRQFLEDIPKGILIYHHATDHFYPIWSPSVHSNKQFSIFISKCFWALIHLHRFGWRTNFGYHNYVYWQSLSGQPSHVYDLACTSVP